MSKEDLRSVHIITFIRSTVYNIHIISSKKFLATCNDHTFFKTHSDHKSNQSIIVFQEQQTLFLNILIPNSWEWNEKLEFLPAMYKANASHSFVHSQMAFTDFCYRAKLQTVSVTLSNEVGIKINIRIICLFWFALVWLNF